MLLSQCVSDSYVFVRDVLSRNILEANCGSSEEIVDDISQCAVCKNTYNDIAKRLSAL